MTFLLGSTLRALCVSIVIAVLSVGGLTATPVFADTEVRLQSALAPTKAGGAAGGTAEWRQERYDNGSHKRTRFEVDVQDVPTNGTGQLVVRRNGAAVFTASIRIADNDGRLRLDSQNGHQVPNLRAGDVVQVLDRYGVVVLQGTLRRV